MLRYTANYMYTNTAGLKISMRPCVHDKKNMKYKWEKLWYYMILDYLLQIRKE